MQRSELLLVPLGFALALTTTTTPAAAQSGCRTADVRHRVRTDPPPAAARTGMIFVANQSSSASLIDLASGVITHFNLSAEAHNAALSPDGRWGVTVAFGPFTHSADNHVMHGNKITVVDVARKQIARTIDTGEFRGLHDVAFRPGQPTRVLVTAQTSRRVLEVDIVTGEIIGNMETRGDRSHMLAVSPDGNTVFSTNEVPGTITRMDIRNHAFVASFRASHEVEGIVVTADGRELWVGEHSEKAVTVRDATTGTVLKRFTGFLMPNVIHATRDGKRVVISDLRCTQLAVADAASRTIIRTIQMPPTLPIIGDFSPDGRIAFVSLGHESAVIALDLETGEEVARFKVRARPDGLRWGPKP